MKWPPSFKSLQRHQQIRFYFRISVVRDCVLLELVALNFSHCWSGSTGSHL